MPLTIHYLHNFQSDLITWLCEELDIPYELKPTNIKHCTLPAPYRSFKILSLSLRTIWREYVNPNSRKKRRMCPANGTFQPFLGRLMMLNAGSGGGGDGTRGRDPVANPNPNPIVALWNDRLTRSLENLDKRFKPKSEGGDGATWLAGDEFTVANIMVVFSLTTFRNWFAYSLRGYDGILGYLAGVGGSWRERRV
ncbi:hypothetical protein RJ035_004643 [Blastomyces gilchristii]